MSDSLTDLNAELPLERDWVFPGQPSDLQMRESVSVWLFEENGAFGFPRMGIEAQAGSWNDRRFQAAFTFPDGRALNGAGRGAPPLSVHDEQGRPAIFGAGPLTFRCVTPFRKWLMTYDGTARDGMVQQQIDGTHGHDAIPDRSGARARNGSGGDSRGTDARRGFCSVKLHVEMTMVTPAWVQQAQLDTNMTDIQRDNAAAMGLGYRFEHHLRAVGTYEIDGKTHTFKGTGLRIHRQSIRQLEGFVGHCWLSAVFPDGSAFGALAYPPREGTGGEYSYNDAVIYKDGQLHRARILYAPFLQRIMPAGDELRLELESPLGRTTIEGVTALSTFRIGNPDMGGLNLHQGGARYRWGDQVAYGMVERSTHASQTSVVNVAV